MKQPLSFFWGSALLAGLLAAGTYAYWQGGGRQRALLAAAGQADTALRRANAQRAVWAAATVQDLKQWVCLNQNQIRDAAVLREAQRMQARTESLVDTLRRLRARAAAPAADLTRAAAHLDRYMAYSQRLAPRAGVPKPGGGIPGWFGEGYDALPATVRRTALTRLESEVRQAGGKGLERLVPMVGGQGFHVYPTTQLRAAAESRTLAPGAEYRARLFLTYGSVFSWPEMEMWADETPLPLARFTQAGQVALPVPGARPGQPDTLAASWRGRIVVHRCYQPDTTLQLTVPYRIVKKPTL